MSDDQDHPRGGDAGTERALDELRVALEQLATRMGAGFREDLAQIRAIAASVAERDLTADVEALRVDVATLVGRGDDSGVAPVLARFEALEAKLDRLAGDDGSTELLARIDALAARVDSLSTSQQVADLFVDLQDNLADVASGEVVGALWDELRQLRTDLPDLIVVPEPVAPAAAEPDPQLAALTDELAVLRTELAEGLVVEPSDALSASLDALKSEVDGLRDALGELRATPEPVAAPPVDDGRDEQLLEQLGALRVRLDEVHGRLDEGLVLADDPDATSGKADTVAAVIDAVADQVAGLRGFVSSELDTVRQTVSARLDAAAEETTAAVAARPQDGRSDEQLLEQLGALRTSIDEMHARLDEGLVLADDPEASHDEPDGPVIDAVAEQLAGLRGFVSSELDRVREAVSARLDAAAEQSAAAVVPSVDDGRDEQLLEQLGAIRSGIDEVRARLDEVPEPVDDADLAPLVGEAPDAADIEAIADQVAALRDFLATELDTVRQTVSTRLDAAAEATAATVAELAARPEPAPAPAAATDAPTGLDPEALDALRDEIRASGAIADQVLDALREELKALRRRIAVKAAERVLDDQQLGQIADAVAARLAEGREQG